MTTPPYRLNFEILFEQKSYAFNDTNYIVFKFDSTRIIM